MDSTVKFVTYLSLACKAGPIAKQSNLLVRGRGDPGSNPALAEWRTKLKPYCLLQHLVISSLLLNEETLK